MVPYEKEISGNTKFYSSMLNTSPFMMTEFFLSGKAHTLGKQHLLQIWSQNAFDHSQAGQYATPRFVNKMRKTNSFLLITVLMSDSTFRRGFSTEQLA